MYSMILLHIGFQDKLLKPLPNNIFIKWSTAQEQSGEK